MCASRPLFRHTGLKNKYEEPNILSSVDSLGLRRRLERNFGAFLLSNKECQILEGKDFTHGLCKVPFSGRSNLAGQSL